KEDAPLLYRLRADKAQLKWAMQFLQECRADRADANLVQMVRLGLYSRDALQQLRTDIGIDYEQQTRGIMHFYTNQAEFDAAIAPTERMQALGCERYVIDINNAVSLEPALYPIAHKLKGATYTSHDESGNAHLFTQRLAERCAEAGVKFLYDTEILAINTDADSARPHVHSITIRPNGENAQT
ncbi:FAD-dependent oxidoreductase, partial [Psychrobacter sp. 16-Bac2893]